MTRKGTILLGILVSALFLYFAVRGARVGEMLAALGRANYWYMIPCVLFTLSAFWVRALRWRYLLYSMRKIPQRVVFSATMIGFMANNVLPARLGELVRAHVVGKRAEISRGAALTSILIERIFDLFTLLALFAVVAWISEFPGGLDRVALIVFFLGLVTLLFLLLWHRYPDRFLSVILRTIPGRYRDRGDRLARKFHGGLGVFSRGSHLILVGILSLLMWGMILIVVWLSIAALSIDVPQPEASMVALVGIALVTMVPSAPGFIGTLQGGGTAALLVFGVPKELGLAFTIVFHATQWIPVNVVGLVYLLREGLSLGQLNRLADKVGEGKTIPVEKPQVVAEEEMEDGA